MATGVKKGWGKLGGGSGQMHKFSGTGTQKPGGSSQEGSGGRRDMKVKAGGHAVGFSTGTGNTSYAGTQTPNQTSQKPSGGDSKFAKGGSGKMFGNMGSQRLEGGRTAK